MVETAIRRRSMKVDLKPWKSWTSREARKLPHRISEGSGARHVKFVARAEVELSEVQRLSEPVATDLSCRLISSKCRALCGGGHLLEDDNSVARA